MLLVAGLRCHWMPGERAATPLLVLPALMSGATQLKRLLAPLAKDRPLLCMDPFEPDAAPEDDRWTAPVASIEAALDHFGLEQVDLLGLSLGGAWAQQALRAHPRRFRHAVLCAATGVLEPRERCILEALRAALQSPLSPVDLARSLIGWMFSPAFLEQPGAVAILEKMISESPFSRESARLQAEALLAHDPGPWLHTLRQVRRVIAGEQDLLIPVAVAARLRAALPDADFEVMAGAGHSMWVEQPQRLAELVLAALPR